jgi:hypothetical protein
MLANPAREEAAFLGQLSAWLKGGLDLSAAWSSLPPGSAGAGRARSAAAAG